MKTHMDRKEPRREYEVPKILHTETLEGRAVVCNKADERTCDPGPVNS